MLKRDRKSSDLSSLPEKKAKLSKLVLTDWFYAKIDDNPRKFIDIRFTIYPEYALAIRSYLRSFMSRTHSNQSQSSKSLLLIGPEACGKSYLVKSVVKSLNLPIKSIESCELDIRQMKKLKELSKNFTMNNSSCDKTVILIRNVTSNNKLLGKIKELIKSSKIPVILVSSREIKHFDDRIIQSYQISETFNPIYKFLSKYIQKNEIGIDSDTLNLMLEKFNCNLHKLMAQLSLPDPLYFLKQFSYPYKRSIESLSLYLDLREITEEFIDTYVEGHEIVARKGNIEKIRSQLQHFGDPTDYWALMNTYKTN